MPAAAQETGTPTPETLSGAYTGKVYSPYAHRGFPERPLWGDSHLHTSLSMDAGLFGNRLPPRNRGIFLNKLMEINRMALNGEFVQHTEYLEIIVTGMYDMEEAIDKFPLVLAACRDAKIAKALIDFRKLGGDVYATEKVMYAWKIEEHYRNHLSTGGQNLQIAYVGQSPLVSTYEPGVEIIESKGLPFALFEDSRKAIEWLGVKADVSPQH